MRKLACALTLLFTFPVMLQAKGPEGSIHGQFYFFTAPIISNTQYYFNPNAGSACYGPFVAGQQPPADCNRTAVGGNNTGFGLDLFGNHGWGVETEFAYANSNWSFSGNDSAIGIGSVDVTDHFFGAKNERRLDPFAAGGYSLYFGERTTFVSGYNLGGGVNLWLQKHVALRLAIRYQGGINRFDGFSQFTHFVAFRFGIALR